MINDVSEAVAALAAIAMQLEAFQTDYPQLFKELCNAAREGSDFNLGDAKGAVYWSQDYLIGQREK